MGLPRSNLVKPKSAGIASLPAAPPPVVIAGPVVAAEAPAADVARESFRTKADSVEVDSAAVPAPPLASEIPQVTQAHEPARDPFASAPSANELLERAVAMGPMRTTWESIVLPNDPILDEKRQPHVAERRARLTRIVKVALGACLGVCIIALVVSAVSAVSGGSDSSSNAAASASVGKTVPSKGIVPVEPMGGTKHAKAHRVAPVVTTAAAAFVRPKRR